MKKLDSMKNITNITVEKIRPLLNLSELPDDINISTITITAAFDTSLDLENIGKYIKLTEGRIVYVKYGRSSGTIRTLIPIKKKAKRKKKRVKVAFYNQVTLKVVSSYKS